MVRATKQCFSLRHHADRGLECFRLAALERNVLADEVLGGDGSDESLAATKRKMAEASRKKETGGDGGGGPGQAIPDAA